MKKIIGVLIVAVAALFWILYEFIKKFRYHKEWSDCMYDYIKLNSRDIEKLEKEVGELQNEKMMKELEEQRNKYIATSSKDSPHWNRDLDKEINDLKEEIENKIEDMEERRD